MILPAFLPVGFFLSFDTFAPPVYGLRELSVSPIVVNSIVFIPELTGVETDFKNGLVYFTDSIFDTVVVQYVPVSSVADSVYRAYLPRVFEDTSTVYYGEIFEKEEKKDDISIGGEKTFGFGWSGTGNSEVRQDLAVNFTGLVSDYWKVGGYVNSGRSGEPIPVGDLDKIYITLESPVLQASLGDIEEQRDFDFAGRMFSELLGIKGSLKNDNLSAEGLYGELKDESQVKIVELKFGFQGPYVLIERRENKNFVPGSEKVYLNGILLQSKDYRIETVFGAHITFSPDVSLSDGDKAIVYFKASGNSFRRFFHLVSAGAGYGEFYLDFTRAGFSDVKDSPYGFTLSDQTVRILESLGDSADLAFVDAGIFVGEGNGSYDLEEGVYVFKGYGKGSYEVAFTKVDSASGDYIYDDALPGFRYAGTGSGDYTAQVSVRPAQMRSVETVSSGYASERLELNLTGARSYSDRNLFSSRDDYDNEGFGFGSNIRFLSSSFNFDAEIAVLDRRFSSLDDWGHKSPVEYFSSLLTPGGKWGRAGLKGSVYGFLSFGGEAGFLENIDFCKERTVFTFVIGNSRRNISIARSDQTGDTSSGPAIGTVSTSEDVTTIAGVFGFSIFAPDVIFSRENSEDTSRFQTDRVRGKLLLFFTDKFSLSAFTLLSRKDIIQQDSRSAFMKSRETGFQGEFSGEKVSAELYASKRTESPGEQNPAPEQSFYLGKAALSLLSGGTVLLNADYSLSRTRYFTRMALFEEVREGEGNYSFDSIAGVYYPDPYGKFIRKWAETGASIPVTDVSLYTSFCPVYGGYSFRFIVKAHEINISEDALRVVFFSSENTMNEKFTIKGSRLLSAGAVKELTADASAWFSFKMDKNLSSAEEGDLVKTEWSVLSGYEYDAVIRFEEEISYGQFFSEKITSDQRTIFDEVKSRTLAALEIGAYEPRIVLSGTLRNYGELVNYPGIGKFSFRRADLSAGLSYSGILRSDASFGFTYNYYTIRSAPAELKAMDYPGYVFHWDLISDARVTGNFRFYASYSGEKRFDENTYQKLSTGIKLLF